MMKSSLITLMLRRAADYSSSSGSDEIPLLEQVEGPLSANYGHSAALMQLDRTNTDPRN